MKNANLYSCVNAMQRRDVTAILEEFSSRLGWKEQNELVLEIGSGSGDVTHDLILTTVANAVAVNEAAEHPRNVSVVGVDVSTKMVEHANEVYGMPGLLSFAHMDIAKKIPPRK